MGGYGLILILFALSLGIATVVDTCYGTRPSCNECSEGEPEVVTHLLVTRLVSVKFYVVALLFIVFDMETVFLYPWAILPRVRWMGFYTMLTFVFVDTWSSVRLEKGRPRLALAKLENRR